MNAKQQHTRYQTIVLFAFSFLTASTYVFMRALSISLFLARIGPDKLPIALAVSAFFVIGVSVLTRIAVRNIPANRAAWGTWLLLGFVTVLIGTILGPLHHSLVALCALYVFAEVRGSLNTIYVVTLSNEAFANHESKRPFAIVASGAPIAGIIVGVVLGIEASIVLVMPAIVVTAVLDSLTAIAASLFRPRPSVIHVHERRNPIFLNKRPKTKTADRIGLQSRYRLFLALLVALKIAVLTLVGYQWKVATGNFYGSNETQMLAYFALFYAVSDTLIVLLQWLVVGRLMDRHGIGFGLFGFPLALSLIAVTSFFIDSALGFLIIFTLGKGLNVLRRALHEPGLTVAYTVMDPAIRQETIVFVKGMVKPFVEALTACALLFIGGMVLEYWITWTWFLLTIPWLYFAIRVTTMFQHQHRDPPVTSTE